MNLAEIFDMNYMMKKFMEQNFRHFNSRSTLEAAKEYSLQIKNGNLMVLSMGGAMSTAEIGISLSKMIRKNKIHAISCTGANLEEDIFNLIGKGEYINILNSRNLPKISEEDWANNNINRVTDTGIPETVMIKVRSLIEKYWSEAEQNNLTFSPYEYIYRMIKSGDLKKFYTGCVHDSWVIAAAEKNIPIFTPGWEDSTLGNFMVAFYKNKKIKNFNVVKSGLQQMSELVDWYINVTKKRKVGFFQIGGGISGDFAICAVPLIRQDICIDVPLWSYFCQISDSTTSYGSYSGAIPSEKITWKKIGLSTPTFMIESDATIIAPLIFSYVLSD
jgi:deoxyhypusine synthase